MVIDAMKVNSLLLKFRKRLFTVETNLFREFCWILPQAIPNTDFSDQIFWLQRIGFDFFANV